MSSKQQAIFDHAYLVAQNKNLKEQITKLESENESLITEVKIYKKALKKLQKKSVALHWPYV